MRETAPSRREYRAARKRYDEHLRMREVLPDHRYSLMEHDADVCLAHRTYGLRKGPIARLKTWLKPGEKA